MNAVSAAPRPPIRTRQHSPLNMHLLDKPSATTGVRAGGTAEHPSPDLLWCVTRGIHRSSVNGR